MKFASVRCSRAFPVFAYVFGNTGITQPPRQI